MHQLIHQKHADGSVIEESECLIHTSFNKGEKAYTADEVFWRADGSSFPVEYWSNPFIINGKVEGSVVTFFDITQRRQAEKEILKAKNEAEKANHAKTEFLARMSHELRTPMNSILGFAQLLDMGELNPKQKKNNNHILTSGRYLLQLIDEVLDISGIESGKLGLSTEPVNIMHVLNELIDSIRPQILEQQLTLKFENLTNDQFFIETDSKRLKQVLLNLLSNAIKYNITGGSVHIKTEIMPLNNSGNASLRISITNTGEVISIEDIQKLFQPFERIGAEKTEIKGTGLGLTVVKKLMDAMGGCVGVESVPNEGNTFWIELPNCINQLAVAKQSFDPMRKEPIRSDITGTILYIEDNESNIELVEQILASHRNAVRLITNNLGQRAVDLAVEFSPGLIFIDLNLPDMHGSEVLANLQSNKQTSSIPVVVISADAMPRQIEKLLKSGAKEYLTKPLDVMLFLKIIDDYFSAL
jgi:signal transduction histidine kinase/CheY-like chemotaxis protein